MPTSPFYTGTTYTKVLCNDGTIQNQASSPNAKFMDACRNNGGRSVNQIPTPTQTQINNTKEPIYYIALTTGVLVVGYLLYKKIKK